MKEFTEMEETLADWADVTRLHENHPRLRAVDWRSPLVRRLLGSDRYQDGQQVLDALYKAAETADVPVLDCVLHWKNLEDDFQQCNATYQTSVITEYAALGLACILLAHCAGLEITEVTRRGQRADYWIGDKELMLEVSGIQTGDIDDLCSRKATQLLANPFSKSGYVCVAAYDIRAARLRFYQARP